MNSRCKWRRKDYLYLHLLFFKVGRGNYFLNESFLTQRLFANFRSFYNVITAVGEYMCSF